MKTLLSALLVTLALSAQAQITSAFDTDAYGLSCNTLTGFISICHTSQSI
jgi:hypothetical protein